MKFLVISLATRLFRRRALAIGGGLAVAALVGWFAWQWHLGVQARAEVQRLEQQIRTRDAADTLRRALNAAEALRLRSEQEDRQNVRILEDEARQDPSADAPALSVRSVNRLNAVR